MKEQTEELFWSCQAKAAHPAPDIADYTDKRGKVDHAAYAHACRICHYGRRIFFALPLYRQNEIVAAIAQEAIRVLIKAERLALKSSKTEEYHD